MRRYLMPLLVLFAAATPAAAKWREARSNHFIIYSEESEGSLRDFATRLERYDSAMRHFRQVPDVQPNPGSRVTVYVVSSMNAVQRLVGGRNRSVAGFYIPRASGSVAIIPRHIGGGGTFDINAQTVLLHEYAHHFLYQNYAGAYPAWFIEGYAEFHSTAKFEKDGAVGLGLPAMHRANTLAMGNPLPLERMLSPGTEGLAPMQIAFLYARGWLLTHYLSFEPKRDGQFAQYLQLINQGRTSQEAAVAAFGDLKRLNRELQSYQDQRMMKYVRIEPEAIRPGPITIRELGAGEEAVMELKIRSRRGVTLDQAKALLPEMRRKAAPFPNDPAVQATLAEAEYDAGNDAQAEAAADRAIAADPKWIDALTYRAMVKMRQAAGSTDPEVWREVRRRIAAANRADPEHPQPLILFYDSFLQQGIAPTPNAVLGLIKAFRLAPQDRSLRMQVGRQFLVDNKPAQAKAVLGPIAYDPHAGQAGKVAAAVIAQIDAGNMAAALEAWEQPEAEATGEGGGEGEGEGEGGPDGPEGTDG